MWETCLPVTGSIIFNLSFRSGYVRQYELNWNTLKERRTQFVASLMYKITQDLAPKQLIDFFQKTPLSQLYNLRGSAANLYLPKPMIEYLKKGLSRGAKLWNSLPDKLRNKHNHLVDSFKCAPPGQLDDNIL